MKLLAAALLAGAVSARFEQAQQILQRPQADQEPLQPATADLTEETLDALKGAWKGFRHSAADFWDETSQYVTEEMLQRTAKGMFNPPKPNRRRPDSEWDYVVKGADVQSVWVENKSGEKEREIDGKLEQYNLRAKKVDPSSLGIDTVTQYSGYLDDEEEDKHLFYCKVFVLSVRYCD